MKAISLLFALMIAIPMFAQAKVITCRGEDRSKTGVKLVARGEMKEEQAYGQYFAVGNFTFKISAPGKPVWEVTLPLAIPTFPSKGYTNIANDEGGHVYAEGHHQLNVNELLSWGHYVRYNNHLIDVSCTSLKF